MLSLVQLVYWYVFPPLKGQRRILAALWTSCLSGTIWFLYWALPFGAAAQSHLPTLEEYSEKTFLGPDSNWPVQIFGGIIVIKRVI